MPGQNKEKLHVALCPIGKQQCGASSSGGLVPPSCTVAGLLGRNPTLSLPQIVSPYLLNFVHSRRPLLLSRAPGWSQGRETEARKEAAWR